MKEKIIYLETEDRNYPLCFNLNVMEEIQEKYGSISKWGEIVENKVDGKEPNIKDLKQGLMIMINEGIDIENEKATIKSEFLNSKQVGRLISRVSFAELLKKIKEVTINSTKTDDTQKNV